MRLEGKVAIVTGAASGFGAATARRFAQEGAKVCLCDILEDEGKAIAASLGGGAMFRRLDVTDEPAWAAVVADVVAQWGRVDILVNNAGTGPGTLDVLDLATWDRVMGINAKSAFLGTRAVVPQMVGQGGGAIVNIGSISAQVGMSLHPGYGASKGAVRTLTLNTAQQYAPQGIRVNTVHPGVMTPMRNSMSKNDPEGRKRMLDRIPAGRTGEPEDIANAVLFLASDEARYITGAELPVDGGYLAQ
ncbi:SDR family NAD(P)-dependent oxidoreductase [Ruixingdingia sedimenti]|uniref:SDR family oxidoreductase n=1 Tax=Ruixingdingia sedimenti TaxID=3073604 RepID=A0ABU1FB14_9RHOB|nr:SDR family oxidoreductase [Xinfangfangia sp. LG-4]MDR5653634.1 SDR family oxidoreductase [Xinfangfangia sp. LG-4]